MNKQDLILMVIILIIGGGFWLATTFINNGEATKAYVYYDNNLIKTIDLKENSIKEYIVTGYNGEIVIEAGQNKIRVKEEESPLHICSKQGWVTSSFESIVCLPNKVVIKIESDRKDVDAVVR